MATRVLIVPDVADNEIRLGFRPLDESLAATNLEGLNDVLADVGLLEVQEVAGLDEKVGDVVVCAVLPDHGLEAVDDEGASHAGHLPVLRLEGHVLDHLHHLKASLRVPLSSSYLMLAHVFQDLFVGQFTGEDGASRQNTAETQEEEKPHPENRGEGGEEPGKENRGGVTGFR